jgi:TonB family protein
MKNNMNFFSKTRRFSTKAGLGLALLTALVLSAGRVVLAQENANAKGSAAASTINTSTMPPAQVDAIVRAFANKETKFREALNTYAFKRDALVQTIGMGGQVTGEYHRVSNFTFDDQGNRFEKISFFPMPTLTEISLTAQDLEDLGGVNPFALEANKLSSYSFKYVGKEKIDELDLFVFDVGPKVMPDIKKVKERFFQGRIWVDTQDLQIVKARGKGVPEDKNNKYPTFETYREQIDGKYWFPTYTYADDELTFGNGNVVRMRLLVKYSDFVIGHGKVTITEVGEAPVGSDKPEPPRLESKTQSPTTQTQPQTDSSGPVEAVAPTEGGILNSKALVLPKPTYSEEAKRVHAVGQVQVKVIVDEKGQVISAEAMFGPEALRQAAVDAAKRARFAPTVVEGITVKVVGILTYDFKE